MSRMSDSAAPRTFPTPSRNLADYFDLSEFFPVSFYELSEAATPFLKVVYR